MFKNYKNPKNLKFFNFNPDNSQNHSDIFNGCDNLKKFNLDNYNEKEIERKERERERQRQIERDIEGDIYCP